MIGYVLDREHAAVTVPDHNRAREPARGEPASRVVVVLDALLRQLEGGTFGSSTVADTEKVVPAPVEGEAGKTEADQHRRQKPWRTHVEGHCVAVEQHHRTTGLALWQVKGTVQRQGIGSNRDQFRAHLMLPLKDSVP